MTTGEKLKIDLKLSLLKNVRICRILGMPINTYIVYYNSRYNDYPINQSTISKANNYFYINRAFNIENNRRSINTPLIDIEDFDSSINGSVVIKIDLIGMFLQNRSKFTETFNIKDNKLEESLYFKDLVKSAGTSSLTKKFTKERQKIMGLESRIAKLIDCIIDKEDNSITFRFLTPATEKYPDNYVFKTVNPVTKELEINASKLYTIEIKLLKFFDWLDTTPTGTSITRKDLKELFDTIEIQIWSDSPSWHYQGMNFNSSLIDGSIFPTNIAPKHWDKYHGEYAFCDKHITGILNNQEFYFQIMGAMLTKKLRDLGYLTKNIYK
jgi:hypothetical protein